MAVLAAAAWVPGLLAPDLSARDVGYAPFDSTPPAADGSTVSLVAPLAGPATGAASGARSVEADRAAPGAPRPVLRLALVDERGAPAAGRFEVAFRRAGRAEGVAPTRGLSRVEVAGPEIAIDVAGYGSYAVWVRGAGLVGQGAAVARLGPEEPAVRFELQRAVRVRGSVADAHGAPLADVAVEAVLRRDGAVVGRVGSRTDAAGWFALDVPPRTRARVHVGDASRPWVPPIEVDAGLGARDLDPIRVDLHAAEFVVVLADGEPAAGARLDGTGLEGGRFGVAADSDGRARVERLVRGRWRVNAALAGHGRESRAVEIPLARDEPVLIVLPR